MEISYYTGLMARDVPDSPDYAASFWDNRARYWQQQRSAAQKDDERVVSALEYLRGKGILDGRCTVADIGCGPGRFSVAFAREAGSVLGLDISPEMAAQGEAHARELGLTNCTFRPCDFAALDPAREGWLGAFDLVFASLTPAVHDLNSLNKMMSMSRGHCLNISHLRRTYPLRQQLVQQVFGRELPKRRSGRWFYALFNTLLLLGYQPETSYLTRRKTLRVPPDGDFAEYLMTHILPPEDHSRENAAKIMSWLDTHREPDGTVLDTSDAVFGRILWDVR